MREFVLVGDFFWSGIRTHLVYLLVVPDGLTVEPVHWPLPLSSTDPGSACPLQIILNSMHKYQPRVHIIKKKDHTASLLNLKSEEFRTFVFVETVFTAVTAYQNQLVSDRRLTRANGRYRPRISFSSLGLTDKLWCWVSLDFKTIQ